jgi:propionyl-CoA carboxylase alpha chain
VAEGERLAGDPPAFTGHAIEVRLYAEDPTEEWRPQSGTLHRFAVPGVGAEFAVPSSYDLRLDSGFGDGDAVSVHYDPMLAKVIAWAPTRDEAARRLATALEHTAIHGVTTNRDLLVRVLRHPAFLAGDIHTHFFDLHGLAALAAPLAEKRAEALSALATALADAAARGELARVWGGLPSGWRNLPSQPQRQSYDAPSGRVDVGYLLNRCGLTAEGFEEVTLVSMQPDLVVLDVGGVRQRFAVAAYDRLVCVDSPLGAVSLVPIERFPDSQWQVAAGSLLAPMPGAVTAVHVAEGDAVRGGQPLLVLEAMKMQHSIVAPENGVVRSLHVKPGDQVESGDVLAVVTADEES